MARKMVALLGGFCLLFAVSLSYPREGVAGGKCTELFDLTKTYLKALEGQNARKIPDDEAISFNAVSLWQKSNTLLHNFLSFQPIGEMAKEFLEYMRDADTEPTEAACKLIDRITADDSSTDIDLTAQAIVLEDMVKAKVLGISADVLKEQTMPMDPTILRSLTYGQSLRQTGKTAQGKIDNAKAQGANGKIIPDEFKHNYVGQFARLVDCIGKLKRQKSSSGTDGGDGDGTTDPAATKNDSMTAHPTKDPTGADGGKTAHPGPADLSIDTQGLGCMFGIDFGMMGGGVIKPNIDISKDRQGAWHFTGTLTYKYQNGKEKVDSIDETILEDNVKEAKKELLRILGDQPLDIAKHAVGYLQKAYDDAVVKVSKAEGDVNAAKEGEDETAKDELAKAKTEATKAKNALEGAREELKEVAAKREALRKVLGLTPAPYSDFANGCPTKAEQIAACMGWGNTGDDEDNECASGGLASQVSTDNIGSVNAQDAACWCSLQAKKQKGFAATGTGDTPGVESDFCKGLKGTPKILQTLITDPAPMMNKQIKPRTQGVMKNPQP
jgi:hypothetical protein